MGTCSCKTMPAVPEGVCQGTSNKQASAAGTLLARSARTQSFSRRSLVRCSSTGRGSFGSANPEHVGSTRSAKSTRSSRTVKTRGHLVLDKEGSIHADYDVQDDTLGEGSNGVVRKGTRRSTGVERAIKIVPKGRVQSVQTFKREIAVMKMMDHPNIIKLYETFEDSLKIFLVMELCQGGELFDRIIAAGQFTEQEAAIVMRQILRAVCYLHENDIFHRDLKPENFLFTDAGPIESNVLKLIDFGLSCHSTATCTHRTVVGTLQYVAPQVLARRYDRRSDLWSCGVIMYTLLSGKSPFGGQSEEEVSEKVRAGAAPQSGQAWARVSAEARDLVRYLLKRNPRDRFSAEQALNHPWLRDAARRHPTPQLGDGLLERLRDYQTHTSVRKAALHAVADQLSEEQKNHLRDVFHALDGSGRGLLTLVDLRDGLEKAGLQAAALDLEQILAGVDLAGSGVISYTEFLAATLDRQSHLEDDVVWSAFKALDSDDSGFVREESLMRLCSSSNLPTGSRRARKGSGGTLTYEDFAKIVRGEDGTSPNEGSTEAPSTRRGSDSE